MKYITMGERMSSTAVKPEFRHKGPLERICGRIVRDVGFAIKRVKEQRYLEPTMRSVRPYTMTSDGRLLQLSRDVQYVLSSNIPGAFVECGVWRGGSSFLIADLLRRRGIRDRKVWMFDSFEGLPPATDLDGQRALEFTEHPEDEWFLNNNAASLEEVNAAAVRLGLTSYVEMVKGWFDATLPEHRERVGQIALLRLDGDWYESVKCCWEQLYDQVAPGGLIILDDYYDWQGCAMATHEFLASRKLPHRIWTQPTGICAVVHKT